MDLDKLNGPSILHSRIESEILYGINYDDIIHDYEFKKVCSKVIYLD